MSSLVFGGNLGLNVHGGVDDLCRFVCGVFGDICLPVSAKKNQDHEMQVPISKYTSLQICVLHSPCTVHMDSNLNFPLRQQRRHISLGIYMCILIFVLLCVTQCGFCSTVPCSKLPDPPPPRCKVSWHCSLQTIFIISTDVFPCLLVAAVGSREAFY